jgi:hypothetical protein
MSAYPHQRPVEIVVPVRRLARVVALTLLFAAFAAVAAFGGYVYGHGGRRSDADVAREKAAAVHAAVVKAVAAKGAADHLIRLKIVDRHVAAQRRADLEMMQRLLLSEQQAGDRRAAAAFARGKAVGGSGGVAAPSRAHAHAK